MLEVPVQRTTKMHDAPPIEMDLNGNRATGTISLPSRSESWQKRISSMGWLAQKGSSHRFITGHCRATAANLNLILDNIIQ